MGLGREQSYLEQGLFAASFNGSLDISLAQWSEVK